MLISNIVYFINYCVVGLLIGYGVSEVGGLVKGEKRIGARVTRIGWIYADLNLLHLCSYSLHFGKVLFPCGMGSG